MSELSVGQEVEIVVNEGDPRFWRMDGMRGCLKQLQNVSGKLVAYVEFYKEDTKQLLCATTVPASCLVKRKEDKPDESQSVS